MIEKLRQRPSNMSSCRLTPLRTAHDAQVCRRSCQRSGSSFAAVTATATAVHAMRFTIHAGSGRLVDLSWIPTR